MYVALQLFRDTPFPLPFHFTADRFNALIQFAMISQAIAAKQVCVPVYIGMKGGCEGSCRGLEGNYVCTYVCTLSPPLPLISTPLPLISPPLPSSPPHLPSSPPHLPLISPPLPLISPSSPLISPPLPSSPIPPPFLPSEARWPQCVHWMLLPEDRVLQPAKPDHHTQQ